MAVSPTEREASIAWLKKFLAAGDRMDPRPWVTTFFAPDAQLCWNDFPPAIGHEAIIAALLGQQTFVASLRHAVLRADVLPDRIYEEATVEMVTNGDPEGKVLRGRGLCVIDKKVGEEVLTRFEIHVDLRELMGRYAEVHGGLT